MQNIDKYYNIISIILNITLLAPLSTEVNLPLTQ